MAPGAAEWGETPTIYHDDGGSVLAVIGPYVLWWLKTEMEQRLIEAAEVASSDILRAYGTLGYIGLFEPESTVMMPSECRKPSIEYVGRYTDHFFGAAMIYERSGFRATLVRSMITAVHLASRARHPLRVFGELEQGVKWLESAAPPRAKVGSEALLDTLSRLRESHRDVRR